MTVRSNQRQTGKPPKISDTLVKEKRRVKKLTEDGKEKRRNQIVDMSASEVRRELKAIKEDEWKGADAGLLKARVFQMYGLGEPPEKAWTKASAIFMLGERGYEHEGGEVSTKAAASETLRKVQAAAELEVGSEGEEASSAVAKRLFETPKNKEKRRLALMQELHEMDEHSEAPKRQRKQNEQPDPEEGDNEWAFDMEVEERKALAEEWFQESEEDELTTDTNGWKRVFNQKVTERYVSGHYARLDMQGVHFYSATVQYLFENPKIKAWDRTGYGDFPAAEGNHDVAEEWLGEMYKAGVKRLGGGGSYEQLNLSKSARRGLAGMDSRPPDPIHLAMFFTQLFQAGEKGGRQRNEEHESSSTGDKQSKRAHVQVPEEVLQRVIDAAEQLAPTGMDRAIITKSAKAVAARTGETFRDKQVSSLRSLGQGRTKEGEGKEFGDLVTMWQYTHDSKRRQQ